VQIEYALTAVSAGQTSLGIKGIVREAVVHHSFFLLRWLFVVSFYAQNDLIFMVCYAASNGVVIATEKKLPSILVDENSVFTSPQFRVFKVVALCFFFLFDSLLTCSFLLQVHKIQLITPNIGVAYRSDSGVRE
jgi:hypothetical protein